MTDYSPYDKLLERIDEVADLHKVQPSKCVALILSPEDFRIMYENTHEKGYSLSYWGIPVLCAPFKEMEMTFAISMEETMAIFGG